MALLELNLTFPKITTIPDPVIKIPSKNGFRANHAGGFVTAFRFSELRHLSEHSMLNTTQKLSPM